MWGAIISHTAVLAQDGKAAYLCLKYFFHNKQTIYPSQQPSGEDFLLEHLAPIKGQIT